MIDELVEIAVATFAGDMLDKAAARHKWARILNTILGLSIFGIIVAAIYVTFKYS